MTLLYNASTDGFDPTLACPKCLSDENIRVYGPMGGPTSYPVIITRHDLTHPDKDIPKDAPNRTLDTTGAFCSCGWEAFGPRWSECLTPTDGAGSVGAER